MPTFKIFMATNHKPAVKGTDYGIWRRIKLIPFTTTIASERQDKHLEERLLAEKSGILNWLLEGVKRWHGEGRVPAIVSSTTDEYRAEMDVIGNFIRERELFKVYQDWCGESNEHACSERFLSLRLKELGLERSRTAEARYWNGIMLKAALS